MSLKADFNQKSTVNLPSLWELDQNNRPKDPKLFLECLRFFYDNYLLETSPSLLSHYFTLIDKTEITDRSSQRIVDAFLIRHPKLFPQILLKIGDQREISIPRKRLKCISPKFTAMLQAPYKEFENSTIVLEFPKTLDDEVVSLFVHYLQSEWNRIEINGKNFMQLLYLASEHQIEPLIRSLIFYIAKNRKEISTSDMFSILKMAFEFQVKGVIWEICAMISQDPTDFLFLSKEDWYMEIIDWVQKLSFSGITIPITYISKKEINIKNLKSLNEETLILLKKIDNFFNVKGLTIINDVNASLNLFDNASVNLLSQYLVNINKLIIHNLNIDELPEQWIGNLKSLVLFNSSFSTIMTALKLKRIHAEKCPNLSVINAPFLKYLLLENCPSFTSFEAPLISFVHLGNVPTITEIHAPVATFLSIKNCEQVKKILAPRSRELKCDDLHNLKEVFISRKTEVKGLPDTCKSHFVDDDF